MYEDIQTLQEYFVLVSYPFKFLTKFQNLGY